ncbi:MAG: heavy metal translocating P-type ATPase [Eubacteriales bacterium]
MTCAACSSRVEKAVSNVKGVTSCSVSLLTNSMVVEGTSSEKDIIKAVEKAGYTAFKRGKEKSKMSMPDDILADKETPRLLKRFIFSLVFLLILMYFSMGYMMWNFPLPRFLDGNYIAIGLTQLLLCIAVMIINGRFFVTGFRNLFHGAPNMDTLVALGSSAAFVYSVYALFAMTNASVLGSADDMMHYMHEFYFESAAMILTLITLGKTLESYSKGKTTNALKSLISLAPKTATLIKDGEEKKVPVENLIKGDIFAVYPGESIPTDGIVVDGISAVDESSLTGESIPVDKKNGDAVFAGTINQSGYIKCEATHIGEDTTLSKIIKTVSEASATKAPIAKIADKVSGIFVPSVIAIAVITIAVWLIAGENFGFALARGISVLVISCPCALGLATPVAIMVGNGVGAKNGILFKNAASLEHTGKIEIVALDKTGTITKGEPSVTDMIPLAAKDEEELLSLAYSIEKKSEHPLAKAIIKKAQEKGVSFCEAENFASFPGNGLSAVVNGKNVFCGNKEFIKSKAELPENIQKTAEELSDKGKTPVFFSSENKIVGIIAVADTIKSDSPKAIRELSDMGIRVVMLTGDNKRTAEAIGREAGVSEVIAGVLPDGKENVIASLRREGRVAMVGDGVNDAPALTRADIGIAIGAGTDVAIDAADIVLMNSRLSDVPAAIRLSRAALRNIRENLFWAFIYNIIGIPLAAGVFIHLTGWQLNPMFGAAAMSLSSFCVVTNALRLNLFDIKKSGRSRKRKIKSKKEIDKMEKTMKIEGMMCGHCEARVKKALEALPEVGEAIVDHKNGTALVKLKSDISDDVLKKTVEDQGYNVIQ